MPRSLYIGCDRNLLFKLYPVPPEESGQSWAAPFSVRSFVYQASRSFSGCYYMCRERGKVFDEVAFSDRCAESENADLDAAEWNCHILAGWSAGQPTCTLWDRLKALCQTDTERKFLHAFLGYVKDRQFPMLIPQVRIGIAERRRPDFVLFVPLHHWNYRRLAIELDGGHDDSMQERDAVRDRDLEGHRYEVVSLRPNAKGYLEEVRSLVEQIEGWMDIVQTEGWKHATEVRILSSDLPDVPF